MRIKLMADLHTACQAESSARHVARQRILFECPAFAHAMASVCLMREDRRVVFGLASEHDVRRQLHPL